MKKQPLRTIKNRCRKNERGAAMVTVLMISFLLLVAVTGLILESSMNTANVTDATAEEQAYYAAESGIQSALHVLRKNVILPDSLRIDTTKPATDPANQIDYFKAAKLATSNYTGDASTDARLSRWLSYDSTYTDRVILGATTSATQPAYSPQNGFAYNIKIINPDNIGNVISFNTVGDIGKQGSLWTNPAGDGLKIQYVSVSATKDVSSGSADNIDFGKFVVTGNGTISTRVRFAINVYMTIPYSAVKTIRGHIETGTITNTTSNVKITYDSQTFIIAGSAITLTGGSEIDPPIEDPPEQQGFSHRLPG
jgi:Tfp pilus assembly protein PilX